MDGNKLKKRGVIIRIIIFKKNKNGGYESREKKSNQVTWINMHTIVFEY